ncbi:replication factor A1 [Methanolinea mesophila]|uniref:OB-fold nucleic acid binding domain-containing protein n=1 Tax=Methanolinea mesophila TaxID=547055 RepID=UPI001AE2C719|nr:OB-fold nucleic acid binding domain-containing protein [Methanolinea mesophila]MBP1929575.1 replication factor A1 [Methanolinea mesophila]
MQFHYALVDDLISREEFERRVEEKITECGDLLDETAAAMLVVQDCGRHHIKIRGFSGGPSLLCFFGKVVTKSPPREFARQDGDPGLVANLILGDETGQVRAVLWDEKAAALEEIEEGDVLEVIAKPGSRPAEEITVLALRKAPCQIECATEVARHLSPPEQKECDLLVLALEPPRTFTRRDGSPGELVEGVAADEEGCARLVCWAPALLDGIPAGTPVHVAGVQLKYTRSGKEYHLDDRSTVIPGEHSITPSFTPLDRLAEEGSFSVRGSVRFVGPARSFAARDGGRSQVRNVVIEDGTGEVRVALWGDRASCPVVAGETVEVYNARAKAGRFGGVELNVGNGSAFLVVGGEHGEAVSFDGTVIVTRHGTFVDDGSTRYLVVGDLPHGQDVHIEGTREGVRITPAKCEPVVPDPAAVLRQAEEFLARLESTGYPEG